LSESTGFSASPFQTTASRRRSSTPSPSSFADAPRKTSVSENVGVKRRCQIPQVDITELSYFLTVVKPIYSLCSFLADNGGRPTKLINKSSSMSLCRT
jgi:hypothetical protein